MFWNGITANDGLSGSAGPALRDAVATSAATSVTAAVNRVATATNGLDPAPFRPPLVENPAKCGDLHVEIAVLDRGSGPDRGNDLGPRDELARPLDQHAEDVERTRTHRQWRENAALVSSE